MQEREQLTSKIGSMRGMGKELGSKPIGRPHASVSAPSNAEEDARRRSGDHRFRAAHRGGRRRTSSAGDSNDLDEIGGEDALRAVEPAPPPRVPVVTLFREDDDLALPERQVARLHERNHIRHGQRQARRTTRAARVTDDGRHARYAKAIGRTWTALKS